MRSSTSSAGASILSLLVEGGAETHASFFAGDLVDKVYAYVAPIVIGGREAPGPVGGQGVARLVDVTQAPRRRGAVRWMAIS